MRIMVAGASGVIGHRLLPILVADGHAVHGTTRRTDRAAQIRRLGAEPIVVDVFDRDALVAEAVRVRPEVVIHQLTDLATPAGSQIGEFELLRTARVRAEGTANLIEATAVSGARRLIAQSAAWLYARGPEPYLETDPLSEPASPADVTLQGVLELERLVLGDPRFDGIVLRYGWLYGPTAGSRTPWATPSLSVDGAAWAAALAAGRGTPGIYNIVDGDGPVDNRKARLELGWEPATLPPIAAPTEPTERVTR